MRAWLVGLMVMALAACAPAMEARRVDVSLPFGSGVDNVSRSQPLEVTISANGDRARITELRIVSDPPNAFALDVAKLPTPAEPMSIAPGESVVVRVHLAAEHPSQEDAVGIFAVMSDTGVMTRVELSYLP